MAQALGESEQLALVDGLADGEWHSGEELARGFGVSRAALSKRIERLKDWQLAIESRQGLGYRLSAPVERLDPARLQAAVGPGLKVSVVPVTDSTNARLMAAAAQDDPQALLAELQTAGRGRRGRRWVTPFGAQLTVSLAWSFDALPLQLGALPLAVGVVCAQVLEDAGLAQVGLKWPNDIVCLGRKLGGILIEHRGEGGGGCRVVIGVGINYNMQEVQGQDVEQPWISLQSAMNAGANGALPARNELAARLLVALSGLMRRYAVDGFAPLAKDWVRFDVTRNQRVLVLQGEQRFEGVAQGIDADGALLVDAHGQRHVLHSGEVSLRMPG